MIMLANNSSPKIINEQEPDEMELAAHNTVLSGSPLLLLDVELSAEEQNSIFLDQLVNILEKFGWTVRPELLALSILYPETFNALQDTRSDVGKNYLSVYYPALCHQLNPSRATMYIDIDGQCDSGKVTNSFEFSLNISENTLTPKNTNGIPYYSKK